MSGYDTPRTTIANISKGLTKTVESVWNCGSKHHWHHFPHADKNATLCSQTEVRDFNTHCTHSRLIFLRQGICAAVTLRILETSEAEEIMEFIARHQKKLDHEGDQALIQISNFLAYPRTQTLTEERILKNIRDRELQCGPVSFSTDYMEKRGHAVKDQYGSPIQEVAIKLNDIFASARHEVDMDLFRQITIPSIQALMAMVREDHKAEEATV